MGKPCIAFNVDDPIDARHHLRANNEVVVNYGSFFDGRSLHTWDDGE